MSDKEAFYDQILFGCLLYTITNLLKWALSRWLKIRPIRDTTSKRITQCVEFEFWSRTRFPGWYLVFSDDIWSDNAESILLVFSVSSSVMSRGLRDWLAILW